ncbi:hypothetical protein [uncultured Winogradskyella sp.]|uniref:hypothetical protein n=1 Tax=uncultured Winogradskyella sp. TaxID=395353 RepID=UPI0035153892
MMKRLLGICALLVLCACDDGDIITVNLDFDKELNRCDNNAESYYVFDLRDDPSESIGVIFPRNADNALLFQNPTPPNEPVIIPINGTTARFIYRTYNRSVDNQELCGLIQASDLVILEDYEAETGSIEVTVTVEDDDQDGVPTIFEGRGEPDENGNYPNAQDTDGDGIPDYLDRDDDGDNVPTRDELNDDDTDTDPNTNPLDTDGDGTPDYLDPDDDGDGVNTISEDEDGNQDPRDDVNPNAENPNLAFYLNAGEPNDFGNPGANPGPNWRDYVRIVTTSFLVKGFDLDIIRGDEYNLGDYVGDPIPQSND